MTIGILSVIFLILILTVGSDRTAKSFITLIGNTALLISVIFAINAGFNPLAAALLITASVSALSLFYQNGYNIKTVSAFVSVMLVSIIMTVLIFLFVFNGHIQGMPGTSHHSIRPSNGYPGDIGVDMLLLHVMVILIALMGSVIDTSLAVTSGCFEVMRHNKGLKQYEIFFSGIRIGGEILCSTVNTLVFVFIGEFLSMFVTLAQFEPAHAVINSKEFAQGVICIMISAAGCVAVIPIASLMIGKFGYKDKTKPAAG